MLRMLQEDQREILEMIDQSRVMLRQPEAADPSTIGSMRWRFDRMVARHIHSLKTEVGDWAAKSRPEELGNVSLVARMAEDLGRDYERHKAQHPAGNIRSKAEEYTASASSLMTKLEHLLQQERIIIFPLLQDD